MATTHLSLLILISIVISTGAFSINDESYSNSSCGYQSCHATKEGFINVHIVAHSHDDVGWLKTVDQYYYGAKTNIQNAGVQYILDSAIDSLRKDSNRRFIYVETAFFWKWWLKQHDTIKSAVRRLVNNGQLEFVSGAWSMNDEAVTNYQSIIDQFTWGLRKLNETFGECGRPKVGWQIDPFGHSREMASIFAQLGFDGLLLGRIDYLDKETRLNSKTAEMVWRGSQNLDENKGDIFTGVMFNTYSPPKGFCFDILCSDEPIIDDNKSPDYNVDRRVDEFFSYVNKMNKVYATNNVIVTMGNDFNYQDANTWFTNLDKLIHYANLRQLNGSKYNLVYSTPSCYVKAIHDETMDKPMWTVKEDDFFPYASYPHAFWTGFYTSRPTIKRFERIGNNYLQICKQLYSLTDLGPEDRVDLNALREAMGIMQHHDAITGTEKEQVAYDYSRILSQGLEECGIITSTALSKIVTKTSNQEISFQSCHLLNVSQCAFTENNKNFVVTVYNPLSRPVTKFVRLPITGNGYLVKDPQGNSLQVQVIQIATPILNIPGRDSQATDELIFQAKDIPPLGFKSYFVEEVGKKLKVQSENNKFGDTEFNMDPETGLISKIFMNNKEIDFSQEFFYYKGSVGDNNEYINRSSGAYIFRPNGTVNPVADKVKFSIFRGPLIAEVHQQFNEWISQIIRVYANENVVEFDWLVGPIPVDHQNGKEIITRYTTNLKTNASFLTDSNGRETLQRFRDFRTWGQNLQEPVSGNYYPITSKIVLKDDQNELAILTDRAQGGSSLKDGEVELMVHRNCLHDDGFGVGEALIEKAYGKGLVARGSHYILFGDVNNNTGGQTLAAQERDLAQRKLLDSWVFLSSTNGLTYQQYKDKYAMQFAGLKRSLPQNVQILTLEPWKGFSFLLRLEHVLEKNEDPNLSKPAVVDLKQLFSTFEITHLKETTLGGNQWLSDNQRLKFKTVDDENNQKWETFPENDNLNLENYLGDLKITLGPMQIRTFIIEFEKITI